MVISFVVVEYFCLDALREAVSSILAYTKPGDFEVIVVSNSAYALEKQEEIAAAFPQAKLIFNQHNVGFAAGVNQGIRESSGRFICLLNPDAKLVDQSLTKAVDFLETHENVAVVGPLITDYTGQVQDSCRKFLSVPNLLFRTAKRLIGQKAGPVLEKKDYLTPHQVEWVSGACMLVRKKAIDAVGLMDERYFLYVEDMDWCRSFYKNGWTVWFLPEWRVEHNARRASTGKLSLTNKLSWIHFISFCKYKVKWFFIR